MEKQGYPHLDEPHTAEFPHTPPPPYGGNNTQIGFQSPNEPKIPPGSSSMPMNDYPQPQTMVMNPQVGPTPTPMVCPHCRSQITSRIELENGSKTHLLAFLLCLVGAYCCSCLPYMMRSCQVANHYCPACNAFLGTYAQ